MDRAPQPRASILRDALGAARTNGLDMAGPACVAAICLLASPLVLPIPIGLWLLAQATRASCDQPPWARAPILDELRVGALASIPFVSFGVSLLVAAAFYDSFPHTLPMEAASMAVGAGLAVVGGIAVAPWMASACVLVADRVTVREAMARSLAVATRLDLLRVSGIGALSGLVLWLPVIASVLTFRGRWDDTLTAAVVIAGLCLAPLATLVLSRVLLSARGASSRSWSSLSIAPLSFVALVLALSLAIAPPAWQSVESDCGRAALTLADDHRASATGGVNMLWIDDPHGARTGFIRAPRSLHAIAYPQFPALRACLDPSTGGLVVAADPEGLHGARIDPEGHRLDDGPLDRLRARDSAPLEIAVLVTMLLASLALRRGRARAHLFGRGALATLKLRLGPGASLTNHRGTLVPSGDVRFETPDGAFIARVEGPVPTTSEDTDWRDGDELLATLPLALAGLGPRQGATALPPGTWLADAGYDADAARTLELARATSPLLFATALAGLVAVSVALLQL